MATDTKTFAAESQAAWQRVASDPRHKFSTLTPRDIFLLGYHARDEEVERLVAAGERFIAAMQHGSGPNMRLLADALHDTINAVGKAKVTGEPDDQTTGIPTDDCDPTGLGGNRAAAGGGT